MLKKVQKKRKNCELNLQHNLNVVYYVYSS